MNTTSPTIMGRVLAIAGSDSGGGAGIQADIKAITCLGGYAATAITALTAQNTQSVEGIHDVPADFIKLQIEMVLRDIGADAIKLGMLHKADVIDAVANSIAAYAPDVPLVTDPVMVAKSGDALLQTEAIAALKERLLPITYLLTPNLPEAEHLLGRSIVSIDDMELAARALLDLGPQAVLLKGGHLPGDRLIDVLVTRDSLQHFSAVRINTTSTHGTGCTLASAIATGLAQGLQLVEAVGRARRYVHEAIRTAVGLGQGHGPLNHGHTVEIFT